MMRKNSPKKTETLEVRLPHAVKQAFMARAQGRGRTASSLVRDFIDSYLAGTDPRSEKRKMIVQIATPLALTSLVASGVALHLMAPTAASAAPDLRALFMMLDRDHNGQLSAEEFVLRSEQDAGSALREIDLWKMLPAMLQYHAAIGQAHSGGDAAAGGQATGGLQVAFQGQDRDGDGTVSYGEFEPVQLGALREAFEFIDFDDHGGVEEGELAEVLGHLPPSAASQVRPFVELDPMRTVHSTGASFRAEKPSVAKGRPAFSTPAGPTGPVADRLRDQW